MDIYLFINIFCVLINIAVMVIILRSVKKLRELEQAAESKKTKMNAQVNDERDEKKLPDKIDQTHINKHINKMENNLEKMKTQAVSAKVARSFVLDAEKTAAALEKIHENGVYGEDDLHRYIIGTHGMKSSLANVHELELSAFALKLEKAGKEKNIYEMKLETPVFLRELRIIINKLTEYIKDNADDDEEDETADVNYEYLHKQLNAIIGACQYYDKKMVKTLLTGLTNKIWPRAIKEQLDIISDKLLSGDFDEAAEIAEKIVEGK